MNITLMRITIIVIFTKLGHNHMFSNCFFLLSFSKIVYQFDQLFSIWRYLVKIWQLFMNFLLFSKPDSIISAFLHYWSAFKILILPHRDRSFLGTAQRAIESILHWELYLNSSERNKRKTDLYWCWIQFISHNQVTYSKDSFVSISQNK